MKINQKMYIYIYNYTLHEDIYIYIAYHRIYIYVYLSYNMYNYNICLYCEGGMVTIPSHGWFMALFFPYIIYVYMT